MPRPTVHRMMSKDLEVPVRPKHHVRRLSSRHATEKDMEGNEPVVIVPEHMMHEDRHHHRRSSGLAAEMSTARQELNEMNLEDETNTPGDESLTHSPGSPGSESEEAVTPGSEHLPSEDSYAFAFDIDGVLIRGGKPIPEAVQAMRVLNGENEWGVKVPYIFLTNGGGKTEAERCLDLSRQLDIEVSPAQFICGHTPMREMVEKYKTVLVVGGEGEKCRTVAEGYGFRDVVTPGDIIKDNQHTTPFRKLTAEEMANSRKRNYGETKIEAIFVFADSRDWAGDVQIMLDLAMSKGGYIGTLSETFDEGPPIYFAHNDVVWSSAHDNVRLGMGALRKMTEMLFKNLTKGHELETIAFGKPQIGTFEFATRLLQQWRKDAHRINRPPETVYFIGDTCESDIRGTNEYNKKARNDWYSILVKTGVYQAGTEPTYPPRHIADNVLEAVKHGMKREFEKKMAKAVANGEQLEKRLERVQLTSVSPVEEVAEPTPTI